MSPLSQLQLQQYANLFNLTSVALVLTLCVFVLRRYPRPFFGEWMRAYGLGLFIVAGTLLESVVGPSWPLMLVQVVLITSAAGCFWRTARILEGRSPRTWLPWAALAATLILSEVVAWLQAPAMLCMVVPALLLSASQVWLGCVVLAPRNRVTAGMPWVGWPQVAMGLWLCTFPFFDGKPYFWVGFYVSGLLQLAVGVGMVVYVLEQTAYQLQQQNAKLQQLDRMKTSFLNTVSHELRTPLTGIVGNLELFEDGLVGPLTSEQREVVEVMRNGSDALLEIVNALLDAAQIEAGALKVTPEPIDLQPVIEQVTRLWARAAAAKQITLVAVLPPALPRVMADPQRLTQVIGNLLSNAIKFTEPGGEVSVRAVAGAKTMAIHVVDNGIGIRESLLPRLFERFYQVDDSSTRRHGGTGLGLSIVKTLVDAMDGELHVESREGAGTDFSFTLPLHAEQRPHLDAAAHG